ncbi:MAG TPA: ATP-binding protein [Candidatus Angelobacter sp.]|jgi:PAS domain S-box-containing protein|nr:ATP-binding protein [Candidatus Angelobacter sp.]
MTQHSTRKQRLWLVVGGVVVALLTAAVFTLGSLNIPLTPRQGNAVAILFALSTFIAALLLVFTLILSRSLLRLWSERRSGQMGSRFKVKMVLGAMGVSLLPVVFLFFFSYALVNRTLNMWFPRPLEIASEQSQKLLYDMGKASVNYLSSIATKAAADGTPNQAFLGLTWSVDAEWVADSSGAISHGMEFLDRAKPGTTPSFADHASISPKKVRTLRNGAEVWEAEHHLYIAGSAPLKDGGTLYIARHLPDDYLARYSEIEIETQTYEQQKQQLRTYKRQIILALLLITLLLLFTSTWVALFLSKQVTLPIQALAEATREISRGNFDHRISVQAQDELGTLVRSFNRMTEQLGEGRRQINEFTQSLEQAIEERERRRKLMEAILENIPTGVVSLNASGEVSRVNSAVAAILGDYARTARTLSELLGEEAARSVLHLMRRSLRMGAASRETEIATGGRLVRAAVTVSSLGPRRSNPGYVVVIDDLTDLLRAQKAAAWQEVAQRIAHEIKNPLTPIQLSAQRLLRHLERTSGVKADGPARNELEKLVAECAGLIEREVQTLESLVNEFSQFARFPSARLAPADVNAIVSSALSLFHERLEGITVQTDLAASLPPVKADPELLRRVVANLIDNAAEAMEGSQMRELRVATRTESDGDAIEIEVSDSGHGISAEDKERLFLPHFSTKERGTGLGLAIASQIVAEHNGTLRVEDNLPVGSRFLLRFPAVDVTVTPSQAGTSLA